MHPIFVKADKQAVPILFVTAKTFTATTKTLGARELVFIKAAGFEAKAGKHQLVPDEAGRLAAVLFGLEDGDEAAKDLFRPGALAALLPDGTYRFANAPHDARLAALAFALGSYQFTRYRKAPARGARLVVPDGVDGEDLTRIVEAVTLARDLINTPSNDMGPAELEEAARELAKQHSAKVTVTSGDKLTREFPLVAAVGGG
jgi:leucyl aminopeptidase